MKREIIVTKDGSHTVEIPGMNVTYHSHHGAIQESKHVFIETGLNYQLNRPELQGFPHHIFEMLLMFTLGREDVFSMDDYGIQMAMKKLYKLDDTNKKEFRQQLLKISGKWTPYRTYACLHLWLWKDNAPVGG